MATSHTLLNKIFMSLLIALSFLPFMKVAHQKNIYYLDLNKNLYRGYIETSLSRESHEKYVVYRSSHLEIEEATLLETSEPMEIEHFNTKCSKDNAKSTKPGARVKARRSSSNILSNPTDSCISNPSANPCPQNVKASCTAALCNSSANNNSTFADANNDAAESTFLDVKAFTYDAFRIKIPDSYLDLNLNVRVVFKPSPNNPAILWYKPVSSKDKHKEVVACNFSNNSSCIAPYIDSVTNVKLYYVIPNIEEVKVVSSGSFKSIREEDKMIIYLYNAISHPKYFMFAVGTYNQSDIFSDNDKRKMFTPYIMTADGSSADHLEVQNDLQALIKYIEGFTKTQELSTCNIVFSLIDVENLVAKNMVVLKYAHFPSQRDVEVAYLLKRILSESLCQQVYHFLNWNIYDSWIYFGFSGYLSDYCVRYLLGNNEFLYNYFEDKQFVVNEDVHEYPLFYTFRRESEIYSEFFKKKSKLVFHSMEANLSFAFLQKVSDEVLELRNTAEDSDAGFADTNNVSISNNSSGNIDASACNSASNNADDGTSGSNTTHSMWTINDIETSPHSATQDLKRCFTPRFIKIVKDATGKDLRPFFDFYVFRPGLMRVKLQFQINKKKNSVRVNASYTPTSLLPGANKRLLCNVDIRSVELEGGFDHSIAFGNENVFYYHTRTKKKKREDEEETMPLLYIRVDPKRLDVFEYTVEQPDYMHIEQLQDKSVVGQLEAICSLGMKPSLSSCEALERLLDNTHIFYKIRVKVAHILRSIKIEEYDGLQRTIQCFIRAYCVPNSTILKSNEFGLISYFIQKHLVSSISQIDFREENALSNSKIVLAFLENILKFNDNSLSQFEDSWYISSVINLFCIHTCFLMCYNSPISESERVINNMVFSNESKVDFDDIVSHISDVFHDDISYVYGAAKTGLNGAKVKSLDTNNKSTKSNVDCEYLLSKCINEIERFRISDMVFPSNNNIITKVCILSYIRLAFYNKVNIRRSTLEDLCRYPNLYSVRLVAIEGLLLLFSDTLPFVLSLALGETPFVTRSILEIVLRIMLLDLKVHLLDTDEYEVNLTERLNMDVSRCTESFYSISRRYFCHVGIADLSKRIVSMARGKYLTLSDYSKHIISKYDYAREDDNRLSILKMPSIAKRIKIGNFQRLRTVAFEESHMLKLPRIKNFRNKNIKDSISQFKYLKVRLTPSRYLVKHTNEYIIRFKIKKAKIRVRKSDIALMLINKYRENKGSEKIDECIARNRFTGFFQWNPLTSDQILNQVYCQKLSACDQSASSLSYVQVFQEIEKSLIFVLSYNLTVSKVYQTAKSLYSYIEYVFLNNAFIKEKVRPMTEESRRACGEFLEKLKGNPSYAVFCYPVDTTDLKNYVDIVRHPVSFYDIEMSLPSYQSIDAFVVSLERICSNCLMFNDSRSVIAGLALQLQKDIDDFKKEHISLFQSALVDSIDVIKDIITALNTENLFDTTIQNITEIKSWGDLESELNGLKKKYSRTSHNGKLIVSSIKSIKEQLKNWFLYDGVRVIMLPE